LGFAGSWTASDQEKAGGGDYRSRNCWHVTGPTVRLSIEVKRIITGTLLRLARRLGQAAPLA